nr:hypothetical protein [Actinomycetota bacterium]
MLSSPRRRRRVVRSSLVVGALGVLLAVGLLFPNTAKRRPDAPLEAAPTLVPETSAPEVQLGGATRRAALGTAQRFLRTAVLRRRVSESWALVHPVLRQGLSRAEWSTGDIPVVPYPVDEARWRLGYSRRDTIGLEVYVAPGEGSKVAPMVFDLELTALG